MPERPPVLYLDLDDTLLTWASGRPRPVPEAPAFLRWALERFEVRWLTTWCPDGEMADDLLRSLGKMMQLPVDAFAPVRGLGWEDGESKVDGVAWLEHRVLGRPFAWVEDDKGFGERERAFLERWGHLASYHHVNVTRDPASLTRAWDALRERFGDGNGNGSGSGNGDGSG